MNKSLVAGAALLIGAALGAPILAWSADPTPQQNEPAAAAKPTPQPGVMGGMGGDRSMGPMGFRGRMREMMAHRMMHASPQQRCEEHLARRAARVAYTITKLGLNQQQRPLWEKVRDALQAAGDKERQLCTQLKPRDEGSQETVLDRIDRREQFLSAHLQVLQQVRPLMQQFYQALNPEQQAIINHPFGRG